MDKVVKRTIEELERDSAKCKSATKKAEEAFKEVMPSIKELVSTLSITKAANNQVLEHIRKDIKKCNFTKSRREKQLKEKKEESNVANKYYTNKFIHYKVFDNIKHLK